ncbi:hypothetical protein B0A50_02870 [Salinomyces thailandicus]|uniref:Uncharacterized protein n=1 Tax=Salinomyces thailandicus TaxID=706561 RepID=A0A4U0U4U7_9PEZI|nr:hypothetical protein B0A50_02870 [Salinomyces thailandica]
METPGGVKSRLPDHFNLPEASTASGADKARLPVQIQPLDDEDENDGVGNRSTTAGAAREGVQHARTQLDRDSWTHRLNPFEKKDIPPVPRQRGTCGEYNASILSLLYFQWIAPLLSVGHWRPLELNDIWDVNPNRRIDQLTAVFKASLAGRRAAPGSMDPLIMAMYDTFKMDFLIGGVCQFIAGCVQVFSPFVLKYLIAYVQEAYDAAAGSGEAPSIGRGIGLVVGITCMQMLQSLCTNQYYYRGMMLGGQARSTMIACIFEKALKLSGRAKAGDSNEEREGWSTAKINNLMSTDTSRIDSACVTIHRCWVAPIQIALALALLCINLTYSALVGFGLFCTAMPLLAMAIKALMRRRKAINRLTDQRIHLTQETFSSIRIVKFFAWEQRLIARLTEMRNSESQKISQLLMVRNAVLATAVAMPILASTLTFITYSLSGHVLNAAPIFSSLALFNALGVPLEVLPVAVGRAIDASAAIKRLGRFFDAEEMKDGTIEDLTQENAIAVKHGSFVWEQDSSASKPEALSSLNAAEPQNTEQAMPSSTALQRSEQSESRSHPFGLSRLDIFIARQEFVAVIGSIGSGKSSVLSALAGEMRKTGGTLSVGGSRAFCSQHPWIQNASVKHNITFGKPLDQRWYDTVVQACALQQDLAILPNGDATEIGEKGVTLSGGQKQRVSLARAVYADADIVLMDDPLSAVDAHVGRHIIDHAICGLLRKKCRVLATHQLHVLHRADRIVWLHEGGVRKIATFYELMRGDPEFQKLMESAGQQKSDGESGGQESIDSIQVQNRGQGLVEEARKSDEPVDALMQREEQATGNVSWTVYSAFITASGSIWNIATVIAIIGIAQGANITTSLWLSWWTSKRFDNFGTGEYIGVYAALGVIQAILMFVYATTLTILGARASRTMLNRAVSHTIHAPIAFFDTTPIGRITNRFSKDVDAMDNSLIDDLRFFLFIIATILSVFCLVLAYYYYFIVALVPLVIIWAYMSSYYRSSAREIKRHETVLRSTVFARFGEAITGTATIRAYGMQPYFLASISTSLDSMDGAYFLTFASQRWLSTRLDTIGALLLFVVGILIVTSRFSVDPSIGGVVLAYMLSIVQLIQETVHVFADVENEMISTERLYFYGHGLEQEGAAASENQLTPATWPEAGALQFTNVQMRYRPGLPLVLKGLTLDVKAGERIGIVGRTGAGKSSIVSVLFRLVELACGSIRIDGRDIATLPLPILRSKLSIIPQDPTLFRGTIRSNLDPFEEYDDVRLWRALRQAGFVGHEELTTMEASGGGGGGIITLDMPVEDEGLNLSLGQRQLLALARVLTRDAKIVVFDEATSSVDFETDEKVQRTTAEAFHHKTLLCIAHRLKTIIGYVHDFAS